MGLVTAFLPKLDYGNHSMPIMSYLITENILFCGSGPTKAGKCTGIRLAATEIQNKN
jgi:hypothetical protein